MIMTMNYDELKIDKEDERVFYNDEIHKYWTKDTKQTCISVTTLIHKFSTFDEAFWSRYKALEALVTLEEFTSIKPILLDKKVFKNEYYEMFGITTEVFEEKLESILAEWARKRDESCVRGTAIHRQHELQHLAGNTKELQHLKLGGKFKTDTSNQIKFGEKGIYPELLLSRISPDGKLRLAGQADLIIIDGCDVYILDYKTNKKLETKSYYDRKKKASQKMKYPLNNLDDVNFWHYSLQLSTYAWMIQKINPDFNIKMLMLIHYDHDGNCENYECQYLKDDVERMLGYYKKQLMTEEFNEQNKPFKY